MIPAHQQPGARVRYNYTDGPVPAGTLGTILGFLGRSQQAQIRWDDATVNNHTPDEYDVVPRGGLPAVDEARRGKKTFETYASEVERALVASGVRPGEAFVWISNHGSFIDQEFKSGTPVAETAERILESERHSAIPWVDEARRRHSMVRAPEPVDDPFYVIQGVYNGPGAHLSHSFGLDDEGVALAEAKKLLRSSHFEGDYVRVITRDGDLVWDSRRGVQEMREATRQTVHAPTSGWTSGKRPSHAEIWADGKPITVAKSGRKWTVTVMGRPVVNGPSGGLTFEG